MDRRGQATDVVRQAARALRGCLHDTGNEHVHEMEAAGRCLDRSATVIEEMMAVLEDLRARGAGADLDARLERWRSLLARP